MIEIQSTSPNVINITFKKEQSIREEFKTRVEDGKTIWFKSGSRLIMSYELKPGIGAAMYHSTTAVPGRDPSRWPNMGIHGLAEVNENRPGILSLLNLRGVTFVFGGTFS